MYLLIVFPKRSKDIFDSIKWKRTNEREKLHKLHPVVWHDALYLENSSFFFLYIYIPNLFPELTFYERVKYLPVVKVNILVHLFVNY